MISDNQRRVLDRLDALAVPYQVIQHPAVYTIEEMDALGISDQGEVAKNLFLRDNKGRRHFLVMVKKEKTVDLKTLKEQLDTSHLSFASEDRLMKYMGLTKGAVSPLGILNDADAHVEVAIDKDFIGAPRIGVHPNDNTATVWISFENLEKVIRENGNAISFVTFS